MKPLPKSGLIVSCYLTDWRGHEKDFIEIVGFNDNVVALRVEGEDNIEYAKKVTGKPILGLIKDFAYLRYITPTEDHYKRCIDAGADFVACDMRTSGEFKDESADYWQYKYKDIIWPDVGNPEEAKNYFRDDFRIVSSTFAKNQSQFTCFLGKGYFDRLNVEGGIVSPFSFLQFTKDVRYVTVGKGIHNPNTIINNMVGDDA